MAISNRYEIDQVARGRDSTVVLAEGLAQLDSTVESIRSTVTPLNTGHMALAAEVNGMKVQLTQTAYELGNLTAKVERLGRLIQYVHETAPELLQAAQVKEHLDASAAHDNPFS